MIYCQLIDKNGALGTECFPICPAKDDYLIFANHHYRVLQRIITPINDTRHAILFVTMEEPENEALAEWRKQQNNH